MQPNRTAAAAAARDLHAMLKLDAPPFDPFVIADRLNVPVQPLATNDFSGCLLQHGNNFAIFYSTSVDNEGFRRFTIAHEIAHRELTHHHAHLFDAGGRHVSTSNFTSKEWFEQEADAFAVELLLPEEHFHREMRTHGIGLSAVKSFGRTFQTSITSTAIRYAELTGDPVVIVVSEDGRVLYSFASGCMKRFGIGYLKPGTQIPNASETGKLLKSGAASSREIEGVSYLCSWFDHASQNLKLDEDVLELGAYGKTLTVLHTKLLPDRDDSDESEDDGGFTPDGKRYRWR